MAVLCKMAGVEGGAALGARELASFLKVPYGFLRKILHKLAVAGIVTSSRGKGGGFMLTKPASQVSVATVVKVLQGPMKVGDCVVGQLRCPHGRNCVIRKPLSAIMAKMAVELEKVSIEKLALGK